MSYTEREIAKELREMYPKELSVFESLQIAVGIRKNDLIQQAFDLGKDSNILHEIAGQLGSIASSIDPTSDNSSKPTGGPTRNWESDYDGSKF